MLTISISHSYGTRDLLEINLKIYLSQFELTMTLYKINSPILKTLN